MKKIVLISLFLTIACLSFGQVRYTYPVEIGAGYSRPQLKDWSHKGETTPEATFNMIECYFLGAYAGVSLPTKISYPDGSTVTTNYYRVGFELGRITWGDSWWIQSFAITPFYSFGTGFNEINIPQGITTKSWGAKVDYSFSILDVSFIASKQELTLGVAIVFPFYRNRW